MPGLGKGMYTGPIGTFTPATTAGGYPIANRSGAVGTVSYGNGSSTTNSSSNNVARSGVTAAMANHMADSLDEDTSVNVARSVAGFAGNDASDYGDLIRQLLDVSANNTAQSQAFAREQMAFQRESDKNAMAWSAKEAKANRDWQERLANSAHQREVKDLVAAGLNPILAANAGAYTGSGATGQGFSSSGAQGTVDTSGSGALGTLFSTAMNTASQAYIAKMYTDTERYSADMQYAQAKLASDTSILNNNNSISAQKAINQINADTAIRNALESANATRDAAGASAAATREAAATSAAASRYAADKTSEWQTSGQQISAETSRYSTDENNKTARNYNINNAPADYAARVAKDIVDAGYKSGIIGLPSSGKKTGYNGYSGPSGMLYK